MRTNQDFTNCRVVREAVDAGGTTWTLIAIAGNSKGHKAVVFKQSEFDTRCYYFLSPGIAAECFHERVYGIPLQAG